MKEASVRRGIPAAAFLAILMGLAGQPAAAQQTKTAAAAAPTGTAVKVFAPIAWADVKIGDPDYRRMAKAAKELGEIRDALCGILNRRIAADSAQEPATDVILDLTEAVAHHAIYIVRPMLGIAPRWRDAVGRSTALERYWDQKEEFAPVREDVRLTFHRRGGKWIGPHMGMVTTKFKQQFHLQDCDTSALQTGDAGVSGALTVTSVRGDFRYDMHFSGESLESLQKEFGVSYGEAFTDWWIGPRECLRPWSQRYTIQADERRGSVLKAVLSFPGTGKGPIRDVEVFLWADDGAILGGYVNNPGKPPQFLVSLNGWSLKNKTLDAEIGVGIGGGKTIYRLQCAISESDAGALSGGVKIASAKEPVEGTVQGVLYRAFAGTYTTEGPDGRWSQAMLAAVAPATLPPVKLPAPALDPAAAPLAVFEQGVDLYRQVAAVDWALRDYPKPVADALRSLREGVDDRSDYWPAGGRTPPAVPEHMHQMLAGGLGAGCAGAASYLEGLVRIARQAVADRKAGAAPVVGVPESADPDFGPHGGYGRMDKDAARVNAMPSDGAREGPAWRLVGDWTCVGFIPRCYSFDTVPYVPEILLERGVRLHNAPLEIGAWARIPHPDPRQHLWWWRSDPDSPDGVVSIPLDCLKPDGVERTRWPHGEIRTPRVLDYAYGHHATWYATTMLHADKPGRVWMAMKIEWDGRLWVNDTLVWRPSRIHTPNRIAVFPVDLAAGPNRLTVCCSARPVGEGNSGTPATWIYKYGEKAFGSFALWAASGIQPRPAEAVAAALRKEQERDRERAAVAAARGLRGRRGDGSARYPAARPALAWDLDKGVNVRWKAALPTDDAEPVIVGKNLFVTTFYGELACLDALTGAERWRKTPRIEGADAELPPYPPPAITTLTRPNRKWWSAEKRKDADNPKTATQPASAQKTAQGERKPAAEMTALQRSCLTPLADVRRVWMHDPRGRVACFDHDGQQIWAQTAPAQVPHFTDSHPDYMPTHLLPPTHPAIVGTRLVASVGEGVAAFDIEKGTECWRRPHIEYLGQFACLDLGNGPNEQVVLLGSGEVLDAATGKTLIERCTTLISDAACQPVVEGRIAYFNAGSSAVRFWLDESGVLCHRVLWDSPTDIRKRATDMNHGNHGNSGNAEPSDFYSCGAYPPVPVIHDGMMFTHLGEPNTIMRGPQNNMRLQAYDATTGCAVSQRYGIQANAIRPVTSTVMAGGFLFCGDEGGKKPYDTPAVPSGIPMIAVTTAEADARRIANSRGLATLAPPVFDGRRMYLAGSQQVVCIERPEALGDRFSEYELDALKDGFFAREIGYRPETNVEAVVPVPLERLPAGVKTVVSPFFLKGVGCRVLGVWPVKDQGLQDDPYAAIAGASGKVIGEGSKVTVAGGAVEFRPVPDEALVEAKGAGSYELNLPLRTVSVAISPGALFQTDLPARGYFYVTIANRRTATLAMEFPGNVRCWLSGTEIKNGQYVRFAPGLYPFLVECRVTPETVKTPVCPVFREFPLATVALRGYEADYNPALEMGRWLDRIRKNEPMLRAIAASGPQGAYAQEALNALARTRSAP